MKSSIPPHHDSVPPESLPPVDSVHRSPEVREGVRTLVELQHASILGISGKLIVFAAIPLATGVLWSQLRAGTFSHWVTLQLMALTIAGVGSLSKTLSLEWRRPMATWGIAITACSSVFQFGPFIGTGLIFVSALLLAALLMKRPVAIAVALLLTTALAVAGGDGYFGWGLATGEPLTISAAKWARTTATSVIGLFGVLFIFLKVQSNLWRSLEKEISLRVRERRLVAEREKVLRGAASAQRLESLGRLAGGVAHDFNNALVVIQCGVESLAEDLDENEREEVIEELSSGVDRAAGTARQLLSFAKRNVEEIGECDPALVVERLAKESRRLLPAHVSLKVNIDAPPRIAVSETALEQMILNLVQNARDALAENGGTVTVSASREESTKGLLLAVSDDGPGMPDDIAERVFEPFFTTRGDRGTGLGLATVWGIVHRHGGEVTLDTHVGDGTTVGLHLPATSQGAVVDVTGLSEPAPSSAALSRVLILEDEAPVRTALKRVLKHVGFSVVEAATVAEAREACRSKKFSLLISDGVVPDGGVGRFIHEFRAQQKNAPVILCSGYLEEDLALEGIARGECSYLAKPFSASELTTMVNQLLPQAERDATSSAN